MFTPQQRRVWPSGWGSSPRTEPPPARLGSGSALEAKGKSIEPSAAAANGVYPSGEENLADRVSKLEQELFDYQYNMGLLLIEKREWAAKFDDLNKGFLDAKEDLKREKSAHLVAIADADKREDILRKALGVEKQCVLDLEKAVRELRSEIAETKFISDSKLAEANALINGVEEKSLEIDAKLRAADAKLAEISRKSSEVERKTEEIQRQEAVIRRERLAFAAEKESQDALIEKQREELKEWDRKLREAEDRIAKGQKIINQREERASENDKVLKKKEKDLELAQKSVDEANEELKSKEDDLIVRLGKAKKKEKEIDDKLKRLDSKSEELRVFEESLKEREKVAVQKLIDEHMSILETKKMEFDLELELRRKGLEDEFSERSNGVEKKEKEMKLMEEKIAKREQALENRTKNFKEKEKDYEARLKEMKAKEKALKSEEKAILSNLEKLKFEEENLLISKAGLEKLNLANDEQLVNIRNENERLKVTAEERSEFVRLQNELKSEIEKYRIQQDRLANEVDDLKQQKENFEKEWDELDEKRSKIEWEMKQIDESRRDLERTRIAEEEKLKEERKKMEESLRRETESLRIARNSFESEMEQERSLLEEKAEIERTQMMHEIEKETMRGENEIQRRREELEAMFSEKERLFKEEKEKSTKKMNSLKEAVKREAEDLEEERRRLEREKAEFEENKKRIQEQQVELRSDIDKLGDLSAKLKRHREEFLKEKERFLVFVEELKSCKQCSELTSEFVLSDMISSQEIEKTTVLSISQEDDNPAVVRTISPVSWIRKCTSKIFSFSPSKKLEMGENRNPSLQIAQSDTSTKEIVEVSDSINEETQKEEETEAREELNKEDGTEASEEVNKEDETLVEKEDAEIPNPPPRKIGRPRINRARTMKAVLEDAKHIIGEKEDAEKLPKTRKRNRSKQENSKSENENAAAAERESTAAAERETTAAAEEENTEAGVEPRKKKRYNKRMPNPQRESRYNLRRPKLSVTVTSSKGATEVVSQNDGSPVLARCGREEAEASEDGKMEDARESQEADRMSYEKSVSIEEDDDVEDDDVDDGMGEASIGKKLWKFFTT